MFRLAKYYKKRSIAVTEPDPREDLGGNDVGRKLLILARELDLQNEFEEIDIQNLIQNIYVKEARLIS
jgi:homoserine dehydrogenase